MVLKLKCALSFFKNIEESFAIYRCKYMRLKCADKRQGVSKEESDIIYERFICEYSDTRCARMSGGAKIKLNVSACSAARN